MTKSELLKKAQEWTNKANKMKVGDERKRALKNAAAYRWQANKLSGGVKKAGKKGRPARTAITVADATFNSAFYNTRPFEDDSVVLKIADETRGDVVIVNAVKGYSVFVELKGARTVWLPLSNALTLANAVKTVSAYLVSNADTGFYDEA